MKKGIVVLLAAVMVLSACSQTEVDTQAVSTSAPMDAEAPCKGTIDSSEIVIVPPDQREEFEMPEPNPEDDIIHYGVDRFKVEELEPVSYVRTREDGYVSVVFSGAEKGHIYSDSYEYSFSAGSSATLSIRTAIWMPALTSVEIGIVNRDTGECWYMKRTLGQIVDYSCTFQNLTAGQYSVYLWVLEPETFKEGLIRYALQ